VFIKLKGIIAVLIFFGGIHSSASYASEPQSEATNYLEQIEAKPKFTMHSSLLMGDKVDVASGSFSFEVVDLSLGGNFALPVEVRRNIRFWPRNRQQRKRLCLLELSSAPYKNERAGY